MHGAVFVPPRLESSILRARPEPSVKKTSLMGLQVKLIQARAEFACGVQLSAPASASAKVLMPCQICSTVRPA